MAGWSQEERDRALDIARERTLKDAARVTGIPVGTIKRWRAEERKKKEQKPEKVRRTKTNRRTKRTAENGPQNKNNNKEEIEEAHDSAPEPAKHSNKARPGNQNARKHGAYSKLVIDQLSEQEKFIYEQIEAEQSLLEELKILRFKLLRLLPPSYRQTLMRTKEGKEAVDKLVELKIDDVNKAYAVERIVDGIRKIVKDLNDVGGADDPIWDFIDALDEARERMSDE